MSTQSSTLADFLVPREPSAYRPTIHFSDRFNDRYDDHRRHLDGEIVRRCITQGEIVFRQKHRCGFEATVGGVRYRIVVNPENGTVATGFPVSLDWKAARESGRWSTDQLEDIEEFLAAGDG